MCVCVWLYINVFMCHMRCNSKSVKHLRSVVFWLRTGIVGHCMPPHTPHCQSKSHYQHTTLTHTLPMPILGAKGQGLQY